MPRSITISAPPEKIDAILQRLERVEGVVALSRNRGASLLPPGDVLAVQASNEGARRIVDVIAELRLLEGGAFHSSAPKSLLFQPRQGQIDGESNETFWDEMAFTMREDTNAGPNFIGLVALAGATAAVGLWTDKVPVVIAAMVIAPAFEPVVRLPFGWIGGPRPMWTGGLVSVLGGYGALALAACAVAFLFALVEPPNASLAGREWVRYWSNFSLGSILTSVFAAAAGALVISGLRSVLTTGVMIALALIPSLAIFGMAAALGEGGLAARAFARWALDAAIVIVFGGGVFWLKARFFHRTRSLEQRP